ncbi:hypothetical protein D9M71_755330 [compost metagenome]
MTGSRQCGQRQRESFCETEPGPQILLIDRIERACLSGLVDLGNELGFGQYREVSSLFSPETFNLSVNHSGEIQRPQVVHHLFW